MEAPPVGLTSPPIIFLELDDSVFMQRQQHEAWQPAHGSALGGNQPDAALRKQSFEGPITLKQSATAPILLPARAGTQWVGEDVLAKHVNDAYRFVAGEMAGWDDLSPAIRRVLYLALQVVFGVAFDYWIVQWYLPTFLQLLFWIVTAGIVWNWIATRFSDTAADCWVVGYIYELVFSVDNLFVFYYAFVENKLPRKVVPKALALILIGQILSRFLLYFGMAHWLRSVHIIHYIGGGMLVYAGVSCLFSASSHESCDGESFFIKFCETCFGSRLIKNYGSETGDLFVALDGKLYITYLFPVVLLCILTDLFLGIDCAIAKIDLFHSNLIDYMSSMLALFVLRASFHILADMADKLKYLVKGISFVLIFIGVELILVDYVEISLYVDLSVMIGTLTLSAVFSVIGNSLGPPEQALDDVPEGKPQKI